MQNLSELVEKNSSAKFSSYSQRYRFAKRRRDVNWEFKKERDSWCPVTVETSVCDEQGNNLLKNFQVDLLSHCIFCLRKTTEASSASSVNQYPKLTSAEHLAGAPRADLSRCPPTVLSTFNRTWSYLAEKSRKNGGRKQDDLFNVFTNYKSDTTFLELPRMCQCCLEELMKIDGLFRDLQNQLNTLGRITNESRSNGKYSYRANELHRALTCSDLDREIIDATTKILDIPHVSDDAKEKNSSFPVDPVTVAVETPTLNSSCVPYRLGKKPKMSAAETVPNERGSEPEHDSQLDLASPEPMHEVDEDDAIDFIDEDDDWSDPDYVKSEQEDDELSWDDAECSATDDPKGKKRKEKIICSSKVAIASKNIKVGSILSEIKAHLDRDSLSKIGTEADENGRTFSLSVDVETGEKAYICKIDFCGTELTTWTGFVRHHKDKHEAPPSIYQCDKCGKWFNFVQSLRVHKHRVHGEKKETIQRTLSHQICDFCKLRVPKAEAYEHVRAHVGEDYLIKCPNPKCPHIYTNFSSLRTHLRTGSPICRQSVPSIDEFLAAASACQVCGHQAVNIYDLQGHLTRIHENPAKNFSCPIDGCPLKFTFKQSVALHISQHDMRRAYDKQKCRDCNVTVTKMEKHLKETHGVVEVIKCNRCPFLFSTRDLLVEHLFEHRHGILSCDICGDDVKFSRYFRLRDHYFKVHNIGNQIVCEHCGHVSVSKRQANQHQKKQHLGVKISQKEKKIQKCEFCEAEFKSDHSLRSHKIREHGAEPYSCAFCSETFCNYDQLRKHERKHKSGPQPEEVFKCEVDGCGKTFNGRNNLQYHISSKHRERSHACEICGKFYVTLGALNVHKNSVHFNIRKYVCDTCGESFTNGTTLQRHMRIHTGERNFTCEICNQKFGYREVLRRHLEAHERKGADFKPNGPMKQPRKRVERKKLEKTY